MSIFSFLSGSCSKPESGQLPTPPSPEITSVSEDEGFIDLTFAIRSHKILADGSQAITAYGMHHGQEVGIIVVLGPKWKSGSLDSDVPFITYQGVVAYQSLGPASDALIQILDKLYGTALNPKTFDEEIVFTGISLEGEPQALTKGTTKIKLFYESDEEGEYAELFTNIELAHGVLQIREKDPEYRSAVIRALTSK